MSIRFSKKKNLNSQKTKIMASSPITSWRIDGKTVTDYFWGIPKSLQTVTSATKLKDFLLGRKAMTSLSEWVNEVAQLFPTLWDAMEQNPADSSVHAVL